MTRFSLFLAVALSAGCSAHRGAAPFNHVSTTETRMYGCADLAPEDAAQIAAELRANGRTPDEIAVAMSHARGCTETETVTGSLTADGYAVKEHADTLHDAQRDGVPMTYASNGRAESMSTGFGGVGGGAYVAGGYGGMPTWYDQLAATGSTSTSRFEAAAADQTLTRIDENAATAATQSTDAALQARAARDAAESTEDALITIVEK